MDPEMLSEPHSGNIVEFRLSRSTTIPLSFSPLFQNDCSNLRRTRLHQTWSKGLLRMWTTPSPVLQQRLPEGQLQIPQAPLCTYNSIQLLLDPGFSCFWWPIWRSLHWAIPPQVVWKLGPWNEGAQGKAWLVPSWWGWKILPADGHWYLVLLCVWILRSESPRERAC